MVYIILYRVFVSQTPQKYQDITICNIPEQFRPNRGTYKQYDFTARVGGSLSYNAGLHVGLNNSGNIITSAYDIYDFSNLLYLSTCYFI